MEFVLWGIVVLLCSYFAVGIVVNILPEPKPTKHQRCLKRIYEMEKGMPELEGIKWVYKDKQAYNGLPEHFLSWEDFPLEAYEPKPTDPACQCGIPHHCGLYGDFKDIPPWPVEPQPSVKIGKATAEDAARHGINPGMTGLDEVIRSWSAQETLH